MAAAKRWVAGILCTTEQVVACISAGARAPGAAVIERASVLVVAGTALVSASPVGSCKCGAANPAAERVLLSVLYTECAADEAHAGPNCVSTAAIAVAVVVSAREPVVARV